MFRQEVDHSTSHAGLSLEPGPLPTCSTAAKESNPGADNSTSPKELAPRSLSGSLPTHLSVVARELLAFSL